MRLNAEDYFNSTVQQLSEPLKEDIFEGLVDEIDIRTLQALELQVTHGDSDLKLGATGGLLNKYTDEASNVDI